MYTESEYRKDLNENIRIAYKNVKPYFPQDVSENSDPTIYQESIRSMISDELGKIMTKEMAARFTKEEVPTEWFPSRQENLDLMIEDQAFEYRDPEKSGGFAFGGFDLLEHIYELPKHTIASAKKKIRKLSFQTLLMIFSVVILALSCMGYIGTLVPALSWMSFPYHGITQFVQQHPTLDIVLIAASVVVFSGICLGFLTFLIGAIAIGFITFGIIFLFSKVITTGIAYIVIGVLLVLFTGWFLFVTRRLYNFWSEKILTYWGGILFSISAFAAVALPGIAPNGVHELMRTGTHLKELYETTIRPMVNVGSFTPILEEGINIGLPILIGLVLLICLLSSIVSIFGFIPDLFHQMDRVRKAKKSWKNEYNNWIIPWQNWQKEHLAVGKTEEKEPEKPTQKEETSPAKEKAEEPSKSSAKTE